MKAIGRAVEGVLGADLVLRRSKTKVELGRWLLSGGKSAGTWRIVARLCEAPGSRTIWADGAGSSPLAGVARSDARACHGRKLLIPKLSGAQELVGATLRSKLTSL
jgi:hypothetical protein